MDLSLSSGTCWHQPGPAFNPTEGTSFILITPGKDFKASQLFFRNHQVPLALPAVPLWACQHTNLLSLIPLSCCRALGSPILGEAVCGSLGRVCPFLHPGAEVKQLLPKSTAHPAAAPAEIQDEAAETQKICL